MQSASKTAWSWVKKVAEVNVDVHSQLGQKGEEKMREEQRYLHILFMGKNKERVENQC